MQQQELRNGYTTGACAAAGVMAALCYENGEAIAEARFAALDSTPLIIPIKAIQRNDDGSITVEVIKFSGDDPDITNGVSIYTTVSKDHSLSEIQFLAGEGVGYVTKPGMSLPVGEPSINNGPRTLIRQVVREVLGTDDIGLRITIAIPAGVELAKRTLNPILGIEGGISVIGTTGVLRPMSEEAFKNSLVPQLDVAIAAGHKTLVFVPGKIGEKIALSWGISSAALIETSNFIGFMLEAAAERRVERVVLLGHIGKLAKVAAGNFHTHNRVADARLETIAAYAAGLGLSTAGTQQILNANTTEDALSVLLENGLQQAVCDKLAERVHIRAERYVFHHMKVGAVLVSLNGEILGMDSIASDIVHHGGQDA